MSRASWFAVAVATAVMAAIAPRVVADRGSSGRENIANAKPATVMVIAADIRDGELIPIASGSGTVVSPDGAILTNHHVITDGARGRPHDLFVVARLEAPGRPLDMTCAGVPARGLLAPDVDLALIQCELDLDGLPFRAERWPSLSVGESRHISPGERLWVLGYPDTGGMALRDSFGQVLGWTGNSGGAGDTYIKTDAAITHGNSGGAAIDQRGDLIGVPSAYRLRRSAEGETSVVVGSVGLIRPIHAARDLLDAARSGWRPRRSSSPPAADEPSEPDELPGDTADEASPSAPSAPSRGPEGVLVTSRVVNAHSGAPIAGAVVAILDPQADPASEDALARAIAWTETDADGVFRFEEPVARRQAYPVVVTAGGYAAAVAAPGLELAADAPQLHDPWGTIALRPIR